MTTLQTTRTNDDKLGKNCKRSLDIKKEANGDDNENVKMVGVVWAMLFVVFLLNFKRDKLIHSLKLNMIWIKARKVIKMRRKILKNSKWARQVCSVYLWRLLHQMKFSENIKLSKKNATKSRLFYVCLIWHDSSYA